MPVVSTRRGPSTTRSDVIHAWSAEWISAPDVASPTGTIPGLDGDNQQTAFETLLFRRDVHLDELPDHLLLRVASDSRHIVWINGVEAVRGPWRSQPHRLTADEVEISGLLREGDNNVAIQVIYFGVANAVWMPAKSSGGLGTAAALIAEISATGATPVLATDSSWAVRRSRATHRLPRTGVEGIPAEVFDASRMPADWQVSPMDSDWESARALPVGHVSGAGRARPPAEPYGAVPSMRRPASSLRRTAPVTTRLQRLSAPASSVLRADHPSQRLREVSSLVVDSDPTFAPGSGDTVLTYDFGRVVVGFLEMEVSAPQGVSVDIDLREERLESAAAVPRGMRYRTRGERDRFSSAEPHGFRVVTLLVHGPGAEFAVIESLTVREISREPRDGAFFRGDPELEVIWNAGVRTVAVSTTDAYIDCPTREQRAWTGDGVVHLEVDLYTNADRSMPRRYLELAASPRPDGLLPMSVAGDIEAAAGATIPAWSLHWIHGVHLYARHQGIDEVVEAALPTAERILRWFVPFVDERGTLRDLPGWGLVDWSSVYTDGRTSIVTGLWGRALREYAALSTALENVGAARWARNLYNRALAGFEDFWDAPRGIYLDRPDDGTHRSRAASQLGSTAAILSGFAPRERWPSIAAKISDPRRLVTKSWIGDPELGFDGAAFEAWLLGHPEPDWDVESRIVRAEPFGASLVHDALAKAGASHQLLSAIRDWSGFLTDGYDTFGEGWGWGTHAHGWSSAPTRDLLAHVVGARPMGYRSDTWRVHPSLGPLSHVEASIVTRHGLLTVQATAREMRIDTPVAVEVSREDGPLVLPPGSHRISRH